MHTARENSCCRLGKSMVKWIKKIRILGLSFSVFERRLAVVLSTLPDERATDIILARFHDGATLQTIGDELGLSRERVRQLVEKYLRKLRQPDYSTLP